MSNPTTDIVYYARGLWNLERAREVNGEINKPDSQRKQRGAIDQNRVGRWGETDASERAENVWVGAASRPKSNRETTGQSTVRQVKRQQNDSVRLTFLEWDLWIIEISKRGNASHHSRNGPLQPGKKTKTVKPEKPNSWRTKQCNHATKKNRKAKLTLRKKHFGDDSLEISRIFFGRRSFNVWTPASTVFEKFQGLRGGIRKNLTNLRVPIKLR